MLFLSWDWPILISSKHNTPVELWHLKVSHQRKWYFDYFLFLLLLQSRSRWDINTVNVSKCSTNGKKCTCIEKLGLQESPEGSIRLKCYKSPPSEIGPGIAMGVENTSRSDAEARWVVPALACVSWSIRADSLYWTLYRVLQLSWSEATRCSEPGVLLAVELSGLISRLESAHAATFR